MSKSGEYPDSDARELLQVIADINRKAGQASVDVSPVAVSEYPSQDLEKTHERLLSLYSDLVWALDMIEKQMQSVEYCRETPREITREHTNRVADEYDRPVREVALMLLEANRRKWLHHQPDTIGAADVREYGFTENQRAFLNELQEQNTVSGNE